MKRRKLSTAKLLKNSFGRAGSGLPGVERSGPRQFRSLALPEPPPAPIARDLRLPKPGILWIIDAIPAPPRKSPL